MECSHEPRPDPAAVLLDAVAGHRSSLMGLARSISLCADDAHDAHQRALLALIRHGHDVHPDALVAWMRVVVRREALAVRRQRLKLVGPVDDEPIDLPDLGTPVDERIVDSEGRDRAAEALAALKPAQLRALLLKARGYSYAEIAEMTGWSRRKVDRCLTEGRRALREHVDDLEHGRRCRRLQPLLSTLADGEASAPDLLRARRHLRHCGHCRATLAEYRRAPGRAAAVAPPAVLVGAESADGGDPGGLQRLFDLIAGGAHERAVLSAHKFQVGIEAMTTGKAAIVAASASALVGGGLAVGGHAVLPAGGAHAKRAPAVSADQAVARRASAVDGSSVLRARDVAAAASAVASPGLAETSSASARAGAPGSARGMRTAKARAKQAAEARRRPARARATTTARTVEADEFTPGSGGAPAASRVVQVSAPSAATSAARPSTGSAAPAPAAPSSAPSAPAHSSVPEFGP